ncbi:MAG: hypothetical protein ACRD3J_02120 [Thermoanaerobaculia bacterium]
MNRTAREGAFLFAAVLAIAVPFAFALLRAITTGTDWRYLWAALAAFAGSGLVIGIGVSRNRNSVVTAGVAALGLVVGMLWAVAEAKFLANVHGAAPWIVSFAFSLCETAGAVLYFMSRPRST